MKNCVIIHLFCLNYILFHQLFYVLKLVFKTQNCCNCLYKLAIYLIELMIPFVIQLLFSCLLAPTFTVNKTEGAMNPASVRVFTSSFAYDFVRK